jgi:hypothetical protein
MTAFIIIVVIAIFGIALYYNVKRTNALTESGRIVKRGGNWYENAEQFTLSGADFERVVKGIQASDLSGTGVSVSKNDQKQALWFTTSTWRSVLRKLENAGDKDVYEFSMLHWKEHNGVVQTGVEMNILLTAVEKVFVSIDPATQVTTRPISVKTKTDFF